MIYIKRSLLGELQNHLSKKEISLIIGPRQSGKTTLLNFLKKKLDENGERTLYLNLDIESDNTHFKSQQTLLNKIQLEIGKEHGFIFIDEIQRKENAGLFLKGLYDLNLPYKFIATGSGSLELKEKIHESLAGRKRLFFLPPLTFEEFVNFKTNYRYEGKLTDYFEIEYDKAYGFFEQYINFGGYPKVILSETEEEKKKIIDEIYQSFIIKDISFLLKVRNTEAFSNLVKILSGQIGQLINYSELSSTLGISTQTVKDYLWYLEKTFIVKKSTPFFKNLRKEISKSPIYYFYDLGIRNYISGQFDHSVLDPGSGFLFQNFIQNRLINFQSENSNVRFWRSKDGAEVDFIIEKEGKIIPIEAKFKSLKKPAVSRSLRSFIGKYKPDNAYIINLTLDKTEVVSGTRVHFLPFHKIP